MRLFRKKRTAEFWNDLSIPARLFFEIIETDNKSKLVKSGDGLMPKKKQLEQAWSDIYDKYFEMMNDSKMRLIIKIKKKIIMLHSKIEVATMVLSAVATQPMTNEHRVMLLEKLNSLNLNIDVKNDHKVEILKALKVTIAGLVNLRELEIDNLKNITKEVKRTFDDNCVIIEEFGYTVDEHVSLSRYISYEKAATKKANNGKRRGLNRKYK